MVSVWVCAMVGMPATLRRPYSSVPDDVLCTVRSPIRNEPCSNGVATPARVHHVQGVTRVVVTVHNMPMRGKATNVGNAPTGGDELSGSPDIGCELVAVGATRGPGNEPSWDRASARVKRRAGTTKHPKVHPPERLGLPWRRLGVRVGLQHLRNGHCRRRRRPYRRGGWSSTLTQPE